LDLGLPPVQLFRDHQPFRDVASGQHERCDVPPHLPLRQALAQVILDTSRRLVATLCVLGQQLENDGFDRRGQAGDSRVRRLRRAGNMAVNPFQGVGGLERERSREQLVKRHAQRVEIRTRVHRAIHAAGLLRRHVGESARDRFRRDRDLSFTQQARGDAKTGQVHGPCRVHQRIGGLDVPVDQPTCVDLADRRREADGYLQRRHQLRRTPAKNRIERQATGVGEHECGTPVVMDKSERVQRPLFVQVLRKRKLAFEAAERLGGRRDSLDHPHQH
jgi:hypothetical protein